MDTSFITMNRVLYSLLRLQGQTGAYLGICVNSACGAPRHPHWDDEYWRQLSLMERPIFTNFPPYFPSDKEAS